MGVGQRDLPRSYAVLRGRLRRVAMQHNQRAAGFSFDHFNLTQRHRSKTKPQRLHDSFFGCKPSGVTLRGIVRPLGVLLLTIGEDPVSKAVGASEDLPQSVDVHQVHPNANYTAP